MIKDRFLWIAVPFFCIALATTLYSPFEASSYDRGNDSPLQNKAGKDAHPTAQQKIYLPTIIKAPAPGTLYATDDIVGNLRYVPAGTFAQGTPSMEVGRYGEEGPQFQHTLTKNLAVMETEVSQGMWAALKLEKGSLPDNPSYFKTNSNNPVESVTWYQAVFFANLLSESQGFTKVYYINTAFTTPINSSNYLTGPFYCNWEADGYRLPTEGEWECFTRAGTTGPFSVIEPAYSLSTYQSCNPGTLMALESGAWFCANSNSTTQPVGGKAPNPWGLKDVHGNLYEWCWDWYGSYPDLGQTDFRGALSGFGRVIRGGCWDGFPENARSGSRSDYFPGGVVGHIGFRLTRSVN